MTTLINNESNNKKKIISEFLNIKFIKKTTKFNFVNNEITTFKQNNKNTNYIHIFNFLKISICKLNDINKLLAKHEDKLDKIYNIFINFITSFFKNYYDYKEDFFKLKKLLNIPNKLYKEEFLNDIIKKLLNIPNKLYKEEFLNDIIKDVIKEIDINNVKYLNIVIRNVIIKIYLTNNIIINDYIKDNKNYFITSIISHIINNIINNIINIEDNNIIKFINDIIKIDNIIYKFNDVIKDNLNNNSYSDFKMIITKINNKIKLINIRKKGKTFKNKLKEKALELKINNIIKNIIYNFIIEYIFYNT